MLRRLRNRSTPRSLGRGAGQRGRSTTLRFEPLETRTLLTSYIGDISGGGGVGNHGSLDGWASIMVIERGDGTTAQHYKNISGQEETITVTGVSANIGDVSASDRFTPFIVRLNDTNTNGNFLDDDNFTMLWIGDSKVGTVDYTTAGIQSFPASGSFTLQAGEAMAVGFLDSGADGLGGNSSVIKFSGGSGVGNTWLDGQGGPPHGHPAPLSVGQNFAEATDAGVLTRNYGIGTEFTAAPTAPPEVATVANVAATDITAFTAVVGAKVLDTGGQAPELFLYWGDNNAGTVAGNWDHEVPLGIIDVGVLPESLSGLTPGTQYFYRIRAENSAGSSWAPATASFTSDTLSLPSLTLNPADPLGAFFAGITGQVIDAGGDPPEVTIFYGLADEGTSAGDWNSSVSIGNQADSFSTTISGLDTLTPYYFRARAVNAFGESWSSSTLSFTTTDAPDLQISEFMAINDTTLETRTRNSAGDAFSGDQETPDWIEIHNLTSQQFDLGGAHLTDRQSDLQRWAFPAGTTIEADGYLVVFASGDDITDPALDENGFLHTDFKLSSDNGEFLAITDGTGQIIDQYVYPKQFEDISFGDFNDEPRYFATPTPGEDNLANFTDFVADTSFSVDRGIYAQPFGLEISTDTVGATIRYTLDSSHPTETHGAMYSGPISITGTSSVRAIAYKTGFVSTNVDTHTYVFPADVVNQSVMSPSIVNNAVWGPQLEDSLKAIPTISLVTPNSISQTERETSIEMIFPDGTKGFQADVGVEHFGGHSLGSPKKNMRISFKQIYGPGKLNYDLFEDDDATDEFNQIILRTGSHDTFFWTHPSGMRGNYVRGRWASDRQLELNQPAPHGRFVHVYINGTYWGQHHLMERPNADFMASYFGGDSEDYDALNAGSPVDGDTVQWNALINSIGNYEQLQNYMDVKNYADYMLLQFYGGNDWDWNTSQNWMAATERDGGTDTGEAYKFFAWDSDVILRTFQNANVVNRGGPGSIWNANGGPKQHEEFRVLLADRAQKYFFNGGMFTDERLRSDFDALADEIRLSIIAETARWGSPSGYTPDVWQNEINKVKNTFAPLAGPSRAATVIQQMRSAGVFPLIDAPSFGVNGSYQHGGLIDVGDLLTISAPAGTIYYTLDGSDPRLVGGGVSPQALTYSGAVPFVLNGHARARVLDGGTWSALNEAIYYFDLTPDIRVSEIMYNPADPTAAEILAGYDSADDFEFIEITNTSIDVLPLDGLRFDNGIEFTFPAMSINPGDYVVVVSNEDAFNFRYGSPAITIAGQYGTGLIDGGSQLANGGEDIELDAPIGGKIQDFDFADGWYDHTDGDGFSLTIRNVDGELDNWDEKDGWRPSNTPGGSPGFEDAVPNPDPGSVIITEVLTHTDGTDGDVIELRNVSGVAIDVGGWWLSDQKKDEFGVEVLTKYQIPANTVIDPKGYVTLNETGGFGFGVIPFALSELGDDVYLSSDASGVAGGYREHVDFGGAPNGISIGLHIKSTGGSDITLLRTPFLGQGNGAPYFEDLVINEVMYHPQNATPDEIAAGFINDDDFEFVEIYNRSTTTTHTLSDFHISSGIGFTFGWYDVAGSSSESWTLEPGATATWNTTGLAADTYEVFARWDVVDGVGAKRDLDGQAIYSIAHDGGTTDVVRDQKPGAADPPHPLDGWVSLGSYAFDGDGEVALTRGTNNPGNWTIADQVKFVDSLLAETVVNTPTLDSWTTANGPTSLGPGEYVVIVSNRPAFDYRYNFPAIAGQSDVAIAGQYTGSLSNSGDGIKLMRKGADEALADTPYYRIDFVNYNDKSPWPTEPDGDGPSLSRNDPYGPSIPFPYGNDPESWFAGGVLTMGTPGERNAPADLTESTVPQNLTAVVNLPYAQVALNWDAATDPDTYVDHYAIYRNGSRIGSSATTSYVDTTANLTIPYSYKVAAVNRDGTKSDRSISDDISIPALISHSVPDDTHISLVFSEPLDQTSAEDHLANYAFDGTLISATLEPDTITVTLTTAAMNVSQAYNLTIDSLLTVAGALMPPGRQVSFVYGAAIGANAPTVAAGIADFSVSEDAANSELVLSTVFADADAGDHLTFTVAVNTNPDLVQASIGAGELHLDYAADHNGTVDITVRATDVAGTWVEDTFTVTVDSIGDNPSVALPIGDVTVDEDADDTVLNLAGAFFDPDVIYFDSNIAGDDDLLTLTVTGNTDSGLVTASIVGGQLTLTYQGDQHGSADITVRATDDSAVNFIEDTFTVTVNPVNDPPVVSVPLADVSVVENAAPTVLNLAAAFGDVDIATAGDNLTYSVTGNTNPGLVDTSVVGTLTYASNTYGTAQITVRATDTLGDWAEETFAVGVGSAGTAKVEHVLVRGSTWSEGFLDHLDAQLLAHPTISGQGYHLLTGGSQLTTLTWNNIDQLVISFSKDVNIQQSDLSLVGVNVASYSFSDFSYDGATFTATWNLSSPIAADKLLIDLDASSITEVATGNPLDGEWTDGVDTFPSGDDTSGGDFQFRFDVLPGNADVAGSVDAADVTAVLDRIFSVPGGGSYSRNSDLDGSGRIDFVDWAIVQSKLGDTLPGGNPTPPPSPPAPSSGPPLQIFLSQTGPSAEEPTRDIARDTIEEIADEFASAPPLIGPLRVPIASSVVHDDVFAELGADQSSRPAGRNQRYLFGRRSHHESTESSRARRRRRDTVDSITADTVFEMFHSEHRRRETIRRDRTIDQDWINKAERK